MLIHELARRADIEGVAAELGTGVPVDCQDEPDSYTLSCVRCRVRRQARR